VTLVFMLHSLYVLLQRRNTHGEGINDNG